VKAVSAVERARINDQHDAVRLQILAEVGLEILAFFASIDNKQALLSCCCRCRALFQQSNTNLLT
jgi:hypothetical protein